MTRTKDELASLAVTALNRWNNGVEGNKTETLREVAGYLVEVREHFLTKTGEPDWKGRTGGYRAWVNEAISQTTVPAVKRSGLLTSIRYHVGGILRQRLGEEVVEDLGLLAESPLERSKLRKVEHYKENAELHTALAAERDRADRAEARISEVRRYAEDRSIHHRARKDSVVGSWRIASDLLSILDREATA